MIIIGGASNNLLCETLPHDRPSLLPVQTVDGVDIPFWLKPRASFRPVSTTRLIIPVSTSIRAFHKLSASSMVIYWLAPASGAVEGLAPFSI